MTEDAFKDKLVRSHESLFSANGSVLLQVLKSIYPELTTAYVIGWTPDQGQYIYTVLVDMSHVISIEIDRFTDESIVLEKRDIASYKKGLKRVRQIQLAVALDLASKDMGR